MESIKPMRTQCLGRHEISLPQSFRLDNIGSSATFYYGHDLDFETVEFQVADQELETEDFLRAVGRRSADIADEINEKTKGPMLLAHEDLGDQTILLRYHRNDISDRSHVHEVHRLVHGAHVFLKAESFKGVMEPVEARLKDLASRVGAVSSVGNAGRGFCIGPVVIDGGNDYEMATIRYRDSEGRHRDVVLQVELSTFKRDEAEPRLVRRLDGNFIGLGFKPRALKKGAAQIADMPAEEWLGRESVEQRVEHMFVIESHPSAPGLVTPTLQITLGTGGKLPQQASTGLPPYRRPASTAAGGGEPVTSSLTDGEVVALWEAIVRSVRSR